MLVVVLLCSQVVAPIPCHTCVAPLFCLTFLGQLGEGRAPVLLGGPGADPVRLVTGRPWCRPRHFPWTVAGSQVWLAMLETRFSGPMESPKFVYGGHSGSLLRGMPVELSKPFWWNFQKYRNYSGHIMYALDCRLGAAA